MARLYTKQGPQHVAHATLEFTQSMNHLRHRNRAFFRAEIAVAVEGAVLAAAEVKVVRAGGA